MSAFTVLTGKSLAKAIKGFGATVATFSAKTHQLAYSALAHVEEHNCPSHLNALFAVTPLNYRGALRVWACDMGKVSFVAEPETAGAHFVLAKGKTSDMAAALKVGPVEYQRAASAGAGKAFDELKALETFAAKLEKEGASPATKQAIEGAIRLLKAAAVASTPAASTTPAKRAARKTPAIVVDNGAAAPAAITPPAAPVAPAAEERKAA